MISLAEAGARSPPRKAESAPPRTHYPRSSRTKFRGGVSRLLFYWLSQSATSDVPRGHWMDETVSPAEEDFARGPSPWAAHSDAAYSAHDARPGSGEHSADETPLWCEARSPNENYSDETHCAHEARSPDGAHSL